MWRARRIYILSIRHGETKNIFINKFDVFDRKRNVSISKNEPKKKQKKNKNKEQQRIKYAAENDKCFISKINGGSEQMKKVFVFRINLLLTFVNIKLIT